MIKDDEVVSVVSRDEDNLKQSSKDGVQWPNSVRYTLREYNPMNSQTIPETGYLLCKEAKMHQMG